MGARKRDRSPYSPPELTEYGEIEELTEQGYGRGPPDEPPAGSGGRGPP